MSFSNVPNASQRKEVYDQHVEFYHDPDMIALMDHQSRTAYEQHTIAMIEQWASIDDFRDGAASTSSLTFNADMMGNVVLEEMQISLIGKGYNANIEGNVFIVSLPATEI